MKRILAFALACLAICAPSKAVVFLNEVYANPPGGIDPDTEYIELLGTPGKKLDGYAVSFIYGRQNKEFPQGTLPLPESSMEIDEFMSLDGLALGENGLLVLAVNDPDTSQPPINNYSTLLSDTTFTTFDQTWHGNLDTAGKLDNNGSATILLLRNRPGQKSASDTGTLLWGKDVLVDREILPIVTLVCQSGVLQSAICSTDSQCLSQPCNENCFDGMPCDEGEFNAEQLGDGNIDNGGPDGQGGNTADQKGKATPGDVSDDLEVVDEVSWEHGSGWEYDLDDRKSDLGDSTIPDLKERNVHALDDPAGFNPDAVSRVDYRTKGNGYAPGPGATGQMGNGNNWQDTATEQWIRGETAIGGVGEGASGPWLYYSNAANADPNAVQPYETHVPLWLNDSAGIDYNYTSSDTYQMMAGRLNPLAVPFIPGDCDRDGDADGDDIAKIAAVFGNDDWIFSNSFEDAPEGDEGDPASQTRPWDVDATGDNGIETCDLQWTLNFQGDTTGMIVGKQYDSTIPSATGVALNANSGTNAAITTSFTVTGGRPLTGVQVGDTVTMTVSGQVTASANNTAGEENGIMQFVQDVAVSSGGVLEVAGITLAAGFSTTRAALQAEQGTNGDLGVSTVNGYSTSFTNGLSGAADLYTVSFTAVAAGSVDVSVSAAGMAKFAAVCPSGVVLGHTSACGAPATTSYPATASVSVVAVSTGACCNETTCADGLTEAECLAEYFVCDLPTLGTACLGDADLSGVVNASDRGFVSANIGITIGDVPALFATTTDFYQALCKTDMDCSGVVNASDRGFVSANIGLCTALPPCMDGSGLNAAGDGSDIRFANSAVWHGAGSDCGSVTCP